MPSHPCSRRRLLTGAMALGLSATLARMAWAAAPQAAEDMARAARVWLDGLQPPQRAAAQLAWDDPWRENWHFTPRRRPGVAFRDMRQPQWTAVWGLLGSLLSGDGLERVRGVIELEAVLGELTGQQSYRDPDNYALVVFGDPAGAAPWAWRFEGHHLSLSVVVVPEVGVAVTPAFFGANPATVPQEHRHKGFKLLGAEETQAFSLVRSLESWARKSAILDDRALGDLVAGPGRETSLKSPQGVPLAALNEAQRGGVMAIVEGYTTTMRPEIAAAVVAKLRQAGVERLHFAWAGALTPQRPHYFRIHGPTALIEYDNSRDGANHVHSLWIDPQDVFGRDLLKAHYERAH